MRNLHIVLPMAGRGSRFAQAGFTTPKPLIEVDGQPMFLKALSSLDDIKATKKFTIIIRAEHVQEFGLDKLLKEKLPAANIVVTNETPVGPVVDALRFKQFSAPDDAVIVLDCDLWFASASYNQMVQESLNGESDIAGGLLTFSASDPRYSFAEIGAGDIVTRTAEKVAISNHAITGTYFFASAQDFIDSAHKLLRRPTDEKMPEYYMSLLYNILIDEGKKIQAAYVDQYSSFGTPEELAAYQTSH